MRLIRQYKNHENGLDFIKWNCYYLISRICWILMKLNDRTLKYSRIFKWWNLHELVMIESLKFTERVFMKFYSWNEPFCMHFKIPLFKMIFFTVFKIKSIFSHGLWLLYKIKLVKTRWIYRLNCRQGKIMNGTGCIYFWKLSLTILFFSI